MRRTFTQTFCLLGTLLLFAVFGSGSAYAQFTETQNFNSSAEGATTGASSTGVLGFQLIKLPNSSTTTDTDFTKYFEVSSSGSETVNSVNTGKAAYIEANPGIGNAGERQYNGLLKITKGITFKKGFIYKATLKAKGGTGTGSIKASSGKITLVTSTNPDFNSMTGTTPHGVDAIVTATSYTTQSFQFGSNIFNSGSQVLYVGFRLHSSADNKSYMYLDDIVITEEPCPSVNQPTVNITSAPACGSGSATLTASGTASGGSYRWYKSSADLASGTHIAGQTGSTYTTPTLTQTTTYYVTAATASGCESSATAVTVTINQFPSAPAIPAAATNSRCGTGTVNLQVTGAPTGGSYRWYTVQTGGTAISGETGSSYTTPSMTVTTSAVTATYYVSAVSAEGCESSTRTQVTATANPLPTAPTIPATAKNSRCGTGTVTLQVTGAPVGATYRWYNSSGTLISGQTSSTFTTPSLSVSTTYYAAIVSSSNCESAKTTVVATITTPSQVTGGISATPEQSEVGFESTYTVNSNIINNGDVASIDWFIINSEGRTPIGRSGDTFVKYTPTTKDKFEIECLITPKSTSCYNVSSVTFAIKDITPLPVEIIYFNAAKQGNNVVLEWATASEKNNTGFEVQVSQDGFNFRKLGFVPTKNGNTVLKQVYTYKDVENGKYGTRYYRLKQIDEDGKFEYFTTKAVSFGQVSGNSLKAFPNPFDNEVSLEINADQAGKLHVQVLDAMGRSVLVEQFAISKGSSNEKIILGQSLPKGIYFVRTEMNGIANNFKLLKK